MDKNVEIQKVIADYECSICRTILACLSELPFQLGAKKVASVLKGVKSAFIIDYQLHNLNTFGVLGNFNATQLRLIIDILIVYEFIMIERITSSNLPVLSITDQGKDFLNKKGDVEIVILDAIIDREVYEFDELEKLIFKKLKKARYKLATNEGVPAFFICSDQTMRKLCELKPRDNTNLLAIKGIGQTFIDKYGESILSTIDETIESF